MINSINNLEFKPVHRVPSGLKTLDEQYGESFGVWGFPKGKISQWAGERGIGKSRLAVLVAKTMNQSRRPVMYVTGELGPDQFASEKLTGYKSDNFYISDDRGLDPIVKNTVRLNPALVIVDSVNTIREYKKGRGGEFIIEGGLDEKTEQRVMGLREAAERSDAHIILLSQLNADGTAKGGTELPHWVDIEVSISSIASEWDELYKQWKAEGDRIGETRVIPHFQLKVGKNRFGKSDSITEWVHIESGVIPWVTSPAQEEKKKHWFKSLIGV